MQELNHLRNFLRKNGYKVPDNDNDVVHIARALMKVKFTCGWRESFVGQGGVLLSGMEQNKPDGD